jgi:hypothetical protein
MRCLDSTGTIRRVCPVIDGEQVGERPGGWAKQVDPAPMEHTRRTHVQQTGGLSLACHQLLAVHTGNLPQVSQAESMARSTSGIIATMS